MHNYFYSIFFSPITNIVFVSSIALIILVLITYFCINKSIISIASCDLSSTPDSIINLLKSPNNYKYWWNKFKKQSPLVTDFNYISDYDSTNTKVTLKISSEYSNEIWHIIIKQISYQKLKLTIIQDIVIHSKIRRVLGSFFFYNSDTTCLKNSLKKNLKT